MKRDATDVLGKIPEPLTLERLLRTAVQCAMTDPAAVLSDGPKVVEDTALQKVQALLTPEAREALSAELHPARPVSEAERLIRELGRDLDAATERAETAEAERDEHKKMRAHWSSGYDRLLAKLEPERLAAARAAMKGILANPDRQHEPEDVARWSLRYADALLAAASSSTAKVQP